jgi:hypothetical protein
MPPQQRPGGSRPYDLSPVAAGTVGVVLMCAGLAGFAFWYQERPQGLRGPASFDSGPATITSLGEITSEHVAGNLLDRQVRLDRASVVAVSGDFLFWVADAGGARVPVVLFGELTGRQPDEAVQVAPGQELRIIGVVRPLADVGAVTREAWLSERDLDALRGRELFISAVRVAPRAPTRSFP